jgi:hypothetical protein
MIFVKCMFYAGYSFHEMKLLQFIKNKINNSNYITNLVLKKIYD